MGVLGKVGGTLKSTFSANEAVQRQAGLFATKMSNIAKELETATDLTEQGLKKAGVFKEDVVNSQKHLMDGGSGDMRSELIKRTQSRADQVNYAGNSTFKRLKELESAGGIGALGGAARQYLTGDGVGKSAARIGTTYAAGALGIRAISGGGISTNAAGESDIAGIPFI